MTRRPVPTELHVIVDNTWQEHAACRNHPTDLFFPTDNTHPHKITIARSICQGCTVRDECLDAALTRNELFGIWGGYTVKERRKIRATRPVAKRLICRHCRTEFLKDGAQQWPTPYCSRKCQKTAANRHLYLDTPITEERPA